MAAVTLCSRVVDGLACRTGQLSCWNRYAGRVWMLLVCVCSAGGFVCGDGGDWCGMLCCFCASFLLLLELIQTDDLSGQDFVCVREALAPVRSWV